MHLAPRLMLLYNYCGLLRTNLRILHFMRIDRKVTIKGLSAPKPCISFVIKDLFDALGNKGSKIIDPSQFSSRIQHLPINTTNLQWFLKAGSDLDYIPYSKTVLSVHGHQKKCCNIHKSIFFRRYSVTSQ